MNLMTWLEHAIADAERRQLPDLRPVLEAFGRAAAALRAADWNADASGAETPAAPRPPR